MGVKSYINTKVKISNFLVIELKTELKIVSLISTRICCPSGNKMIIWSMAYESRELTEQTSIDLPGLYSGFYINPFGEYDFYAIPHRSRQFHLLRVSLEVSEFIMKFHNDSIPKFSVVDNNTVQFPMVVHL
jgi:hypothetical protein